MENPGIYVQPPCWRGGERSTCTPEKMLWGHGGSIPVVLELRKSNGTRHEMAGCFPE